MNQDAIFRPFLVAGCLTVLAIMLNYRIKSWASGEKLDRRQEGAFILATLRPIGLALWVGVIAYMSNPASMAWSSVRLAEWLRWTGVAVFTVAVGLLVWTLHCLGTNLTDTVVTRQAHTLVANGPYRWVRHPFYDCVALLVTAISLITANWFFLLMGAVLFALVLVRTRTEEEKLLARFGDSYQAYRDRTGRFFPRIAGRRGA